jgi:predicted phage replisome organizer
MDWVKIMCNILDHRKIKMIRKGPEGNTLVLLWLLMLAEAGKCNRGGYLMVSDKLPYSSDTLSMITDIPLPTVQLGLTIFAELEMIDSQDGAIYIRNWRKYQSEDKLEKRREMDRLRKQRCRVKEREKLAALPPPEKVSRDVTLENRQDKKREEKTTTNKARLLLSDTPLVKVSDKELLGLEKRHGSDLLLQAADIAAETWRRNREEKRNPGGYLNTLCASLVVPDWYVPCAEREKIAEEAKRREAAIASAQAAKKAMEREEAKTQEKFWDSLSATQREQYIKKALNGLPGGMQPAKNIQEILARSLAWEEARSGEKE